MGLPKIKSTFGGYWKTDKEASAFCKYAEGLDPWASLTMKYPRTCKTKEMAFRTHKVKYFPGSILQDPNP